MLRLILVRHSKAVPHEPGLSDDERSLTERGRAEAGLIGAYIAHHGLVPDRTLVSTAKRTMQTWTQAAAALHRPPPMTADARIYNAGAERLFRIIAATPATARTLMLIGHNPGLQELALTLVASGEVDPREALREKFPTSGVAVIDFAFDDWSKLHPRSGRLERFVNPKSLAIETK